MAEAMIGIVADKSGKVHFKNLIGHGEVETQKPIDEDNVFWIASMTKMFAGASIMIIATIPFRRPTTSD